MYSIHIIVYSLIFVQVCSYISLSTLNSKTSLNAVKNNDILAWKEFIDTNKADSKVDGNGLSITNIQGGDTLYSLPLGICLDCDKAKSKFGPLGVSSRVLRTGQLGMLAILLLSEKYQGSSSKYSSYIKFLPLESDSVVSWSKEELEILNDATTRNILGQIKAIESDYERLITLDSLRALLPSNAFTLEDFKWAIGHVKSKHVYLDDQPYLVPGMETLEHDPTSTAEPITAGAGMFGGKIGKVMADRSYDGDKNVFMSYGLKSSAQCLEDHGIVPDVDLQDSSCELVFNILEGEDKFYDDKVNLLEAEGFTPRMTFDLEADEDIEIDPLLMQFLRLKFITGIDSFILEACLSATAWNTLSMPFSKENELAVLNYLNEQCQLNIDNLKAPTTSSSDSNINNDRLGLMQMLYKQEIAALEGTQARIRYELDSVQGPDPREYYQERRLRELDLLRPLDESEVVLSGDLERPFLDDDDGYSMY